MCIRDRLIGLSLLLYPTVSDYWNSFHQTKAITTYAENVADVYKRQIVDNGADGQTPVTAQFANKKIVIDWYKNNKFLYNNGATVTITYTCLLYTSIRRSMVAFTC